MVKQNTASAKSVINFSVTSRRKIFDFFLINKIAWYGEMVQVKFLARIFNLKKLPTTDSRFENAEGDIIQHTINNDDWEDDWIFTDSRFNLLNCPDSVFFKFLTLTIHPIVRRKLKESEKIISFYQDVLSSEGFEMYIMDSIDNFSIYGIKKKSVVSESSLTFFVVNHPSEVNLGKNKKPCIVLVKDNWNDFGYRTLFQSYYLPTDENKIELGYVRITDGNTEPTYQRLSKQFVRLDSNYISLGGSLEYYERLSKLGRPAYMAILSALNDIAIKKRLILPFKNNIVYETSLLRSSESVKALNEAGKYFDIDFNSFEESLKFTFKTVLDNADSAHELDFNFKASALPHRINVLIGKNGTGKTQVLANIANSLSGSVKNKNSYGDYSNMPKFSKIITFSYSAFDFFDTNSEEDYSKDISSYKYCGIRKNREVLFSTAELRLKFMETLELVIKKNRRLDWKKAIDQIINVEIDFLEDEDKSLSEMGAIYDRFSSGQKIVVTLITEVIAFIQPESLLLLDEPELHLHPNSIIKFIGMINLILERFNSYAIIATHSPIILQQVPAEYVIHFLREGNTPYTRKLDIETFGENYSYICEEVFNTLETPTNYKDVLLNLSEQRNFSEVVSLFQKGLSINAKIYLNSLEIKKNEADKTV